MHKKLAATLTIAIFLLSTLAILAPAQAHFTLGLNQPNYPYHIQDFDKHVNGVIGYVWPGGGENTYLGAPSYVTNVVSPGYVPPYPVNSLTAAGHGAWPQNYAQLDGHEYAPFGAIVVNTSGDLIFAINATSEYVDSWTELYILVPPEFKLPGVEQVVTTITNNYAKIHIYTLNPFDRYAPGWSLIRIGADYTDGIHFGHTEYGPNEWYYVRVNGVTAPSIAGKYFFKMYLYNSGTDNEWVPTQNWPVLLVKGELDPAIITGTIRYGGYNPYLYGQPLQEAGKVTAVMTTKLDPYTGQSIVDCTTAKDRVAVGCADAVAYFNGTVTDDVDVIGGSSGHYELEGVAPGIYDIYASAAGYPEALIASAVQVLKGQSLHFDGYLNPGPVIHGDVFSKHAFGSEPWPYNMYIKIELYTNATVDHVQTGVPVSWSPLPCVAGGQDFYYPGNDAAACGDPRTVAGGIEFPWHEYEAGNGAGGVYQSTDNPGADPQGVGPAQTWYVQGGLDSFHYEFGRKAWYGAPRDLDGHVPQQYATWVNGLTAGRYYVRAWVFRYVQSALDGSTFQEYSFEVTAQEWAGDISMPMDLRISSWVNKTVHFHNNAGTLLTSTINTGAGWLVGDLYASESGTRFSYNQTELTDYMKLNGVSYVTFYGINDTWLGQNYGIPSGTYKPTVSALGYLQQTQDLVSVTLSGTPIYISNHLYRGAGFNFTVYSIDWERPRVNRNWVWGYPDEQMNIGIGIFTEPDHVFLSEADYLVDGSDALAEPTLQDSSTYWVEVHGLGTNEFNPSDGAEHAFFGIEVGNHRIGGSMSNSGAAFNRDSHTSAWAVSFSHPAAFDSGQYSFQGWTYGYIQNKDFTVYVNKGQVADIKITLVVGVNITVDILFKKEHLLTPTPYDMSARVRVFDDAGMLVGTWMSSEGTYPNANGEVFATDFTPDFPYNIDNVSPWIPFNYVPAGTSVLHVRIAGFPTGAYSVTDDTFYTFGDPVFTPGSGDFELDNWPFDYWSVPNAHFPNQGILGSPDYTGGWTVEVDFVNWYINQIDVINSPGDQYYPVVPGLLMGESYHIIPGTQATSRISLTEDGALNDYFLGHSMAPSHIGPYSQQGAWSLSNAHLSGEASGIWEVDLNGYVSGTALAFTWSNEFRTLSWYTVTVTGAGGMAGSPFMAYTYDGVYEFYLTPGTYAMTLSGPGYAPTSMGTIAVTDGQGGIPGSGNNIALPPSNIPIPEFSGIAIVAFSALAASLYLLRRKRR